ncbi:CHAT domain-containing protein [Streptomyces sp. NPDC050523]|uniref:CHAT domain-containing protein n=1 Tax=Streptomyces sp. NPDC050523 TaxID=3365622 RepID=UPI0037B3C7C1
MGQWKRTRLLRAAARLDDGDTDPSRVLEGLLELTAADPQDLRVLLGAAKLFTTRAQLRSGSDREADRAAAAELFQRCVALAPPGHAMRGAVFYGLGEALFWATADTSSPDVAAESVHAFREAVAATPHRSSIPWPYRFFLALQLGTYFERSGDLDAVLEAVQVAHEGYAAAAPRSEERGRFRTLLVTSLRLLADATAHVEPLHEAVGIAREAVSEARGDNRAQAQFDLARALKALHAGTRDTRLLDEAVEMCDQCLRATSRRHPELTLRGALSASVIRMLAEDRRDPDLMRQAVELMRTTFEAQRRADEDGGGTLIDIVQALVSLHSMTGEQHVLQDAEETARLAVAAASGNGRTEAQFNLAQVLLYGSSPDGGGVNADGADATALQEALRLLQEVAAATPRDHQERGDRLWHLGIALRNLADRGDGTAQRRLARDVFAEAASSAGPVHIRVRSLHNLGAMEAALGDAGAALSAYESAVALLPRLTPDWLTYAGRLSEVRNVEGLPAAAAAAAVGLGRPERAVELLELSRGLLQGRTLEDRDLRELRHRSPQLHAEFTRLRADLNAGARDGTWEELLGRIRGLAGLEGFLLPPSVDSLRQYAGQGPVVMVNAGEQRGDALILRADGERPVQVVPLAGLTRADVSGPLGLLAGGLRAATDGRSLRARRQAQRDLDGVLRWLWDKVTSPVLDALGITGPYGTRLPPRIWWCPVGVMAYFPLHAAGHHDGGGVTVMDRAVSSYTTTVRALAHRTRPSPGGTPGALVVAVPHAEGAPSLPGASAEAAALAELLPNAVVLSGAQATYENVVRALPAHAVAHLSCHGVTYWESPAAGTLVLHDHLTRPLTVEQISAIELPWAELAYLSACSTSFTHLNTVDEAVHITGAFQLAGYRNVVGTLWPVNDATSADIARTTYERLTQGGNTAPRTDLSAHALHQALRSLRDRYPASPSLWAGHIHVGR